MIRMISHVQEDTDFDKDRLVTHVNQSWNWLVDEWWPVHHGTSFAFKEQSSKIECMDAACFKWKQQEMLFQIVTGEEQWCLYVNVVRKATPRAKAGPSM